jgi:hypothetical protein
MITMKNANSDLCTCKILFDCYSTAVVVKQTKRCYNSFADTACPELFGMKSF